MRDRPHLPANADARDELARRRPCTAAVLAAALVIIASRLKIKGAKALHSYSVGSLLRLSALAFQLPMPYIYQVTYALNIPVAYALGIPSYLCLRPFQVTYASHIPSYLCLEVKGTGFILPAWRAC